MVRTDRGRHPDRYLPLHRLSTRASAPGPSGAFTIYGVMCLITIWIVARYTPETKGHSLEEIERLWKG
ncbi:MAG: MFS transporter [Acidobacteria bacterium]|nr:MFS transporter [Acidobacteriota bacterium]